MLERLLGPSLLALLGLLMAGGAALLAGLGPLAGRGADLALLLGALAALYLAALVVAWRTRAAGWTPALVLGLGLLMRAPLLAAPPRLSDDIYRYAWDGRVARAGLNPYRYAPADTALAALRDADWSRINNPRLVTIYPPLAQFVFRAAAEFQPGVLGLKALFVLCDLALALLLWRGVARMPGQEWRLPLYWWHPLGLTEWAWSGHADILGLLLLVVAVGLTARPGAWRGAGGGLALGLAALVKFLVLPLAPFLVAPRRWWLVGGVALLTVALCYLPYRAPGVNPLGSLGTYAAKWRANDFLFAPLVRPGTELDQDARLLAAKRVAGALLVSALLLVAWRRPARPTALLLALGATLLLSPVVHPWYVAWLVPLVALRFSPAGLCLSLTVLLAYHPLPRYLAGGAWHESWPLKWLEFAPVLALAAWELARGGRAWPGQPTVTDGPGSAPLAAWPGLDMEAR